jgi:hypothetical protein
VDVYASGDEAVWDIFAASVRGDPVSLHTDNVAKFATNADYAQHFNVPGILRAGGLPVAENLVNTR